MVGNDETDWKDIAKKPSAVHDITQEMNPV